MESAMRFSVPSRRFLCLLLLGNLLTLSACQSPDPLVGLPPPGKTNAYIERSYGSFRYTLDLLFVIDGSPSMKSKRDLVRESLSSTIRRLAYPDCVDQQGGRHGPAFVCPEGSKHESTPVESLNVGIISASLGGHGSSACPDEEEGRYNNDRAHLIPSVRPDAPNPEGSAFLTWRSGNEEDLFQLVDNLEEQIDAVGTNGCEYPAPLEAWYRFLVDPSPPARIVVNEFGYSGPARGDDGNILLDQELLAQRQAFLRPQSLVSIVVLSDKNDCSVMEGGPTYEGADLGHWLLETDQPFSRPPSICEENPNDRCCFSCLVPDNYPAGCDASECLSRLPVPPEEDPASLRCFDSRRRFGMDFLYPPQRYIDALSRGSIVDSHTGQMVDNPLLRGAGQNQGKNRAPGIVFFTGVIGVPWQDIASYDALQDPSLLDYQTAEERVLVDPSFGSDRWTAMLGEPGLPARSSLCVDEADTRCGMAPSQPLDPFMIESIAPRSPTLSNPISGSFIQGSDSRDPRANQINGHEFENIQKKSLQFACTFPLAPEQSTECSPSDPACQCSGEPDQNSPLCQPPGGGAAGTTQYSAGAQPGTRVLEVLRGLGYSAIVDSICPKNTEGTPEQLGYQATYQALGYRTSDRIHGRCFPKELTLDEHGQVDCALVEAIALNPDFPDTAPGGYGCAEHGREETPELQKAQAKKELRALGMCGAEGQRTCDEFQFCNIPQLRGPQLLACLTDPVAAERHDVPGFCYIDETQLKRRGDAQLAEGTLAIVGGCPANERRLMRSVGQGTPRPSSIDFLFCQDTAFGDASSSFLEADNPPVPAPAENKIPLPEN